MIEASSEYRVASAMIKNFHANQARLRRHQRLRKRLVGSEARPRLNIFRSGTHIYAQVIDDASGQTLASASSLDVTLRDFKPAPVSRESASVETQEEAPVEVAAEVAAGGKKGGAKKAPAQPAKGAKGGGGTPQRGPTSQVKTVLPSAQKTARKTQTEALAAIAGNRKVALAREVGKLVAQRAKEKGLEQVVFDRGGYAYHGRVAALAEGAREAGLKF